MPTRSPKGTDTPVAAARSSVMHRVRRAIAVCCTALFALQGAAAGAVAPFSFSIVAVHPHDSGSFTEGLAFYAGSLYESTGLVGHSMLRENDVMTGSTRRSVQVPALFFAEGLTRAGDRWIQLTWMQHVGFVYDDAFRLVSFFPNPYEGWGLGFDGSLLVPSDGSDVLHFLDPSSFKIVGDLLVRENGVSLRNLDELEIVGSIVLANVWQENRIVAIDRKTGEVVGWLHLLPLQRLFQKPSGWDYANDVLNRIAYDPGSHHLFVTGKCWPIVVELSVPALPYE